ncbi:MAG: hypothetical protein RJA35_1055 [Actinomycetota bacterium]
MAALPNGLGGAYDLSALANRARAQGAPASSTASAAAQSSAAQSAGGQSPQDPGASMTGASTSQVNVAGFVMDITPAGLAKFVKLSEQVPVLVEFHTLRAENSSTLSAKLAAEVLKRDGAFILLRLDGDQSGELLQAFQINGLPSVGALLRGQPIVLFNGDQEAEIISQVLDKVLLLAAENGVTEKAVSDGSVEVPAQPTLPPRHQAAYDAIEAGNYAQAVAEFEAALNDSPADVMANTGLAQAKLLVRTDGLDFEAVLSEPAGSIDAAVQKADVLAVIGRFDKAFEALLDTFEVANKEDREVLRAHLLELFKVAGNSHPDVAAARARLTNLLY